MMHMLGRHPEFDTLMLEEIDALAVQRGVRMIGVKMNRAQREVSNHSVLEWASSPFTFVCSLSADLSVLRVW